jgi:hypothetical protein
MESETAFAKEVLHDLASGKAWGIVRYLPGSGRFPDEDLCAFDGWYFIHEWAQAVYADWCWRYPDWNVSLVVQEEARFSGKEATRVIPMRR